jgi:hypothetical protein
LLTVAPKQAVRLWDVATGWPVGTQERLPVDAKAIAFGQGGETILAVTADGTISRWSVTQPWAGSAEEIQARVQALTGQEIDPEDDVIRPLSPDAW